MRRFDSRALGCTPHCQNFGFMGQSNSRNGDSGPEKTGLADALLGRNDSQRDFDISEIVPGRIYIRFGCSIVYLLCLEQHRLLLWEPVAPLSCIQFVVSIDVLSFSEPDLFALLNRRSSRSGIQSQHVVRFTPLPEF